MKKILLLTFISCTNILIIKAQTGGGCNNAIPIVQGVYTVDSMIAGAATFAKFEPFPTKAKWYKFSPTQDGLLNISACGGGADTRLHIYVGTCSAFSLFAENDDYCTLGPNGDESASDISKFVKAGKTYFIEWDNSWDTVRFKFALSLNTNATVRETQACQSAKLIAPGIIKVDSLFGYASHGDAARANWYKFTPKSNGKISLSTCGVDIDSRLYIYKGDCSVLTSIGEGDDECDGIIPNDRIAAAVQNLAVIANTTYYFEWDDSWQNDPFDFAFSFDATSAVQEDETLSKSVVLSPNPAADFVDLNFDFEKPANIKLTIFNTVGQAVLSKKTDAISKGVEKLDISDLKSGIYIVEIAEGIRHINKKLVINR
jgi:Secretion system C-terminal sorting domain